MVRMDDERPTNLDLRKRNKDVADNEETTAKRLGLSEERSI